MEINAGDTAWVLMSAALVMLMTPGLAFFYGGMVRSKSVLNMMMMSFITIGIVSVLWVLYGYSVAFGDTGNGLWGGLGQLGLTDMATSVATNGGAYPIPLLAFVLFQMMFAIITPALISGAIADRAKFTTWAVFVGLWATLVYFPVAHWVFDFGGEELGGSDAGWLANLGVLDFAGGTAVHINAGAAGLALAIILGRRIGWPKTLMKPHNLPFVLLGAALLWFGWFGFNAGSALGATPTAALAFATTMIATATAVLGWVVVERFRDGHPTSLGAASGAVAGLVAITPACAFVSPIGAIAIGFMSGVLCALAVGIKFRFKFDDSLDVVGIHLVGGIIGSLAIGLFATTSVNELGKDGLFYGGGIQPLLTQSIGVVAVLAYSFVVTFGIGYLLHKTIGFRVSEDVEVGGIDLVEHAETAYDLAAAAGPVGGTKVPIGAGLAQRKVNA
jgi:Amt family ammonium transporter